MKSEIGQLLIEDGEYINDYTLVKFIKKLKKNNPDIKLIEIVKKVREKFDVSLSYAVNRTKLMMELYIN